MFSRVVGAGLALIAAAVLAAVLATPLLVPAEMSLFAGHPTVNGRLRTSQEVYVGLYEARLCNRGGDGTCKSGNATVQFRTAAYSGLATTGILMLGSVALALSVFTKRERRSRAVWVVRLAAVATIGAAAALLALGPFDEASVPIGIQGVALYGSGILSALLASVLVRPPPPRKLRVAERPSQPLISM
ncbi:MAG: hypothetical protein H7138_13940, partial [Myxococcales bacterium]|nr:hypothetical protein [Myxococcales bacterium]